VTQSREAEAAALGHAELAELVVQKAALILPQLASAVDNACKGSGVVLSLGFQRIRWDRIVWDRMGSSPIEWHARAYLYF